MIRRIIGFAKRMAANATTNHTIRYVDMTKEQREAFDAAFVAMDEAFAKMRDVFTPPKG